MNKLIPKTQVKLDFPELRQTYNYDCGITALQQVLIYYGIDKKEGDLIKKSSISETSLKKNGLPLEDIVSISKSYGLESEILRGSSIDKIKELVSSGYPPIILLQAWKESSKDWKEDYSDGHYAVCIGFNKDQLIFEDPSSVNRTSLGYQELEDRWHGLDDDGKTKNTHVMITIKGKKNYDSEKIIPMKQIGGRLVKKPTFEQYYKTVPQEKNDTISFNLRDAYKELPFSTMQNFAANPSAHLTDKYKLPTHPTFSVESKYSTPQTPGGEWVDHGNDKWEFKHSDATVGNSDRTIDYLKGTKEFSTYKGGRMLPSVTITGKLIPKNQTGSVIVNRALVKANAPAYKEKVKEDAKNKWYAKSSGKLEEPFMNVEDFVTLGGTALAKGIGKAVGKKLISRELVNIINKTPLKQVERTGPTIFKDVWHSSEQPITKFNPTNPGGYFAQHGGTDRAIFFADRAPESQSFLVKRPYKQQYDVQMNKPHVIDFKTPEQGGTSRWAEEINRAEKEGYDGTVVRGIRDNQMDNSTIYASFDSDKIRPSTNNLTKDEVMGTLKSFGNMLRRGTYPLRHIGSQKKMQRLSDAAMESFRNPESIRRMQDLGIDSEKFLSSNPKVTSKPWNSYYSGISDAVNMDLDQLKRLKKKGYNLTDKVVIEHELSHRMQGHQSSPFLTDDLSSTISKDKGISSEPLNIDKRIIKELPMASDRSLTSTPLESKDYFVTGGRGEGYEDGYGIERFPHLMELKKEMLEAGVLKNRADLVDPDKLSNFASYHGGDKNRIMSFIAGGDKSLPVLSKYMNKLPVVGGAILGAKVSLGKKNK